MAEQFNSYLENEDCLSKLKLLVDLSGKDVKPPYLETFGDLSLFCMEESSFVLGKSRRFKRLKLFFYLGCRPKVLYHMKVGSWTDRQPGYNPYGIDDSTDKNFQMLNPNRPPKVG